MNEILKTPLVKKHIIVSFFLFLSFALLILVLLKGLTFDQSQIPSELIGKPALPFKAGWIQGKELLSSASDQEFKLSDVKGRPLILNFWASWCVSCRQEAHELELFWREYKARGVFVVGIAIQDSVDDAMNFAHKFGKTYILGLDRNGKASIDYGVTGVPETFMIDRRGKIVHKVSGPVTKEMLEQYLPLMM